MEKGQMLKDLAFLVIAVASDETWVAGGQGFSQYTRRVQ